MTEFRVLVADKAKAQLYKLPSRRSALQALQCFINPGAQVPERALGSSRQGRVTSAVGGARHAYQPKTSIKEHAEEVFVRQVGSALATDARVTGAAPIVLVAAPRLLGVFCAKSPAAMTAQMALWVPSNVIGSRSPHRCSTTGSFPHFGFAKPPCASFILIVPASKSIRAITYEVLIIRGGPGFGPADSA